MDDDALSIEEYLPLGWERRPLDDFALAEAASANMRVLRAVEILDNSALGGGEDAADDGNERLHAKLDLMLILIAELIPAAQRPLSVRLRLSSRGVLIVKPDEGYDFPRDEPWCCLQLHPSFALTWRWPVTVRQCGEGNLEAQFAPMPEALLGALERFVFQRHRRKVGLHRRSG